jgi:hypothetical protein
MKRNIYFVAFPGGDVVPVRDSDRIGNALEQGDSIYFIDGNIGFIATPLSIDVLTERLEEALGSHIQFFLADITNTDRAGNMVPRFWEFLHAEEQVAAE